MLLLAMPRPVTPRLVMRPLDTLEAVFPDRDIAQEGRSQFFLFDSGSPKEALRITVELMKVLLLQFHVADPRPYA
jgi:hypothetical protein